MAFKQLDAGRRLAASVEPDVNELRRSLRDVQDTKLARVVALLDGMTDRGAADGLIDSARDRLARLRPPRPLRFARLLFWPFDLVIVTPSEWRVDQPTVPRSVLLPIAATVRHALGDAVEEIDRMIAGRTLSDAAVVEQAGTVLWPRAALILATPPPPIRWKETGLAEHRYPVLAQTIAGVLQRLPALRELIAEDRTGAFPLTDARLAPLLSGLERAPPLVQAMMLTLLLAAVPAASDRLESITILQRVTAQARDRLWSRLERRGMLEAAVLTAPLDTAAAEVHRLGAVLRAMDAQATTEEQRGKLRQMRQRLDESCRTRFAEAIGEAFLAPMQALSVGIDGSGRAKLEAAARHLRELETEGRRVGGGATYDRLLAVAAAEADSAASAAAMNRSGRVRLTEILMGPEAAATLWDALNSQDEPDAAAELPAPTVATAGIMGRPAGAPARHAAATASASRQTP